MKYQFEFYKKAFYDKIEKLVLNSYQWENPIFGLSRFEFGDGLHPAFFSIPMHGIGRYVCIF